VLVGAAVAYASLPDGRTRLHDIEARAAATGPIGETAVKATSDARVYGKSLISRVVERYHDAMAAAREARSRESKSLWQRYEVAKREGRLPSA
jgi:hypothetical protein